MKISNDFVDILDRTISLEEEQEILDSINPDETKADHDERNP